MLSLFIDVCQTKQKQNNQRAKNILTECCKYFEQICAHLNENELAAIALFASSELFEANKQTKNGFYFQMLSAILHGIGKYFPHNKALIEQMSKALDVRKLIENEWCYQQQSDLIHGLLFYLD